MHPEPDQICDPPRRRRWFVHRRTDSFYMGYESRIVNAAVANGKKYK